MSLPVNHIAHFDLDAFFVSVEILKNPSLRGKPLIVGGDGQRGIVAACSYEARVFGIQSAMPSLTAKRLCPQAVFIRGSYADYSHYSRLVTSIIADRVPLYEKASIDEFYIDLGGMEKFFGVSKYTAELRNIITRETGLPISCGLSTSKLVSKMATNEAKPNGYLEISPGQETAFLWPLAVEKIPMVGRQTEYQLKQMGICTIGDLAQTPVETLEKAFGKWGESLWKKAAGVYYSPVEPYSEQKSISRETTFDEDKSDPQFLHNELVRLTERAAYDLRSEEKLTGCVTVKIKYADFEVTTKQEIISYTALDDVLLAKASSIFEKACRRDRKIRLLGVRFSQLIPFTMQMNLFDNTEEKMQLYQTIDGIKNQFGAGAVTKATVLKNRKP